MKRKIISNKYHVTVIGNPVTNGDSKMYSLYHSSATPKTTKA